MYWLPYVKVDNTFTIDPNITFKKTDTFGWENAMAREPNNGVVNR